MTDPQHNPEGAVALIDDEIRRWMSGDLCRCSAYVSLVATIREAAGESTEYVDIVVHRHGRSHRERVHDATGRRGPRPPAHPGPVAAA